jgi:hypothetical protein
MAPGGHGAAGAGLGPGGARHTPDRPDRRPGAHRPRPCPAAGRGLAGAHPGPGGDAGRLGRRRGAGPDRSDAAAPAPPRGTPQRWSDAP